jgi:hypothetical protein
MTLSPHLTTRSRRGELDVAANVADLGGNVVDHQYHTLMFDGVGDGRELIDAGASCGGASRGCVLLCRRVGRFCGRGSSAIIKAYFCWAAVQTCGVIGKGVPFESRGIPAEGGTQPL